MGYRYGHIATAMNGILKYVQTRYPNSDVAKSTKDGSIKGFNDFMRAYRESRGSNPSKDYFKNAIYIQNDFKPFAEYCKQKLSQNGN